MSEQDPMRQPPESIMAPAQPATSDPTGGDMPDAQAFWATKRVLITGGAGFLAYSLVNSLKDRAATIVRLDRPGAAFAPVQGAADIVDLPADVRAPGTWERWAELADVIFHLAAQTSAVQADADPEGDRIANVVPMTALINASRRRRTAPAIVFAGTATECGVPARLPVDETAADQPTTAYDRHKLMAEHALKEAAKDGAVMGVTLRLTNLYGPGPRSSSSDRGVLNHMIRRALAGETLVLHGTGTYVRDFLFVEDAARSFLAAAEQMARINGTHYVVGTGIGTTLENAFALVAERVAKRCGRAVAVRRENPSRPLSPLDERNFIADSTRFAGRTGWRSTINLQTGLDRTIDCFLTGAL